MRVKAKEEEEENKRRVTDAVRNKRKMMCVSVEMMMISSVFQFFGNKFLISFLY